MSTIARPPERRSDEYRAALLDLADLDRQIDYLEGEVQRSRLRQMVMAAWCAVGWLVVLGLTWRSLWHLVVVVVGMVGRILGGLF